MAFCAIKLGIFIDNLCASAVTVNGQNVQIPTGAGASAAIDTGTTLIGGPSEAVQNIFTSIPGNQPLSGQLQGFYAFRAYTL